MARERSRLVDKEIRKADEKHEDFYRRLRARMRSWLAGKGRGHKWADILMAAPDLFHLLVRLSVDPDVPRSERAKLWGAIAFFISPVDLIPELVLGPVGFIDDAALAAYVLHSLLQHTDAEVLRRHWAGDGDVLEVIQRVMHVARQVPGLGRIARMPGGFDGKG